jgi:hypothetical protein
MLGAGVVVDRQRPTSVGGVSVARDSLGRRYRLKEPCGEGHFSFAWGSILS